ncbi:hypothetical protein [Rhodococcus kronopolitis]|uniref:Iron reductase n=1 Tax=Rhodococcus kronopolitis TaxID=1460226 RepID=A0ABV9FRT5_9NOCA
MFDIAVTGAPATDGQWGRAGQAGVLPAELPDCPDTALDIGAALEQSSARLRAIYRDYPRVYAVALMAEQPRRRWWSLRQGMRQDRLDVMVDRAAEELGSREAAGVAVTTALIHAVVGRVAALVMLEGRAWDAHLDNLWLHLDSDGGVDWAGVVDPVLRVLPGDRWAGTPSAVTLPCEEALLVWTACRCRQALTAVFDALDEVVPTDRARAWALVGEAVLGAATMVPALGGVGESVAMRRGQGLLDAFESAGLSVRMRANRQLPRGVRAPEPTAQGLAH